MASPHHVATIGLIDTDRKTGLFEERFIALDDAHDFLYSDANESAQHQHDGEQYNEQLSPLRSVPADPHQLAEAMQEAYWDEVQGQAGMDPHGAPDPPFAATNPERESQVSQPPSQSEMSDKDDEADAPAGDDHRSEPSRSATSVDVQDALHPDVLAHDRFNDSRNLEAPGDDRDHHSVLDQGLVVSRCLNGNTYGSQHVMTEQVGHPGSYYSSSRKALKDTPHTEDFQSTVPPSPHFSNRTEREHAGQYANFQPPKSLLRSRSRFPQPKMSFGTNANRLDWSSRRYVNSPPLSLYSGSHRSAERTVTGQTSPPQRQGYHLDQSHEQRQSPSQHQSSAESQMQARAQAQAQSKSHRQSMLNNTLSCSDIADLAEKFVSDINQRKLASDAKYESDRKAWEAEKQRLVDAEQILQARIEVLQQDQHTLNDSFRTQKAKLEDFTTRAAKFKVFVDGLGNDIDTLRREANSDRLQRERLSAEMEEHGVLQNTLIDQMSGYAEEAVQLKRKAIETCNDAHTEMNAAISQNLLLEQQLEEKSRLLMEEKQLRIEANVQISSAVSANDTIIRALGTGRDAILKKLHDTYTRLEMSSNHEATVKLLENIYAEVQGLTSQEPAAGHNITAMRDLLESLSQAIGVTSNNSEERSSLEYTLKSHLEESLKSLKADLYHQEALATQDAVHQQVIADLRKSLAQRDTHVSQCEEQLIAARARESDINGHTLVLQSRLQELQGHVASRADLDVQLQSLKLEFQKEASALETSEAKVREISNEISILNENKTTLQDEVLDLRQRLEIALAASSENAQLKLDIRQKIEDALEHAQKEWQSDADQVRADMEATHANTLASMKHELRKALDNNASQSTQLGEIQAALEERQKRNEQETVAALKTLVEAQQLGEKLQHEVDDLKADISRREAANIAAGQEVASLKSRLIAQETETEKTNSQFRIQVEELSASSREAQSNVKRVTEELKQERTSSESIKAFLQNQLSDAQQSTQDRLEKQQTMFQDTLEKEAEKWKDQIKTLQKRIAEADQTAAALQELHAEESLELLGDVAELGGAREDSLSEADKRGQIIALQGETIIDGDDEPRQAQPCVQNEGFRTPCPPSQDGTKSQPLKPRKIIERNSGADIISYQCIPAPEVLRQSNATTCPLEATSELLVAASQPRDALPSSALKSPGSIVEESQNVTCPRLGDDSQVDCKTAAQQTNAAEMGPFASFKAYGTASWQSDSSGAFRKPAAAPNSGSKLVHSRKETLSQESRGYSDTVCDPAHTPHKISKNVSVGSSSSPAFILATPSSRTTYNKQCLLEHNAISPAKRKPRGHIVAGFEPERKKRITSSQAVLEPPWSSQWKSSLGLTQAVPLSSSLATARNASREATGTRARGGASTSRRSRRTRVRQDHYEERFSKELKTPRR